MQSGSGLYQRGRSWPLRYSEYDEMLEGVRPASAAVQKFWRHLRNAYVDADGFLHLVGDTTFVAHTRNVLMVRTSYIQLYDAMLEWIVRARTGFLITAPPGIGKSFFGYYLMYRLALEGHTVVYQTHGDSEHRLLFRPNQVVLEGGKNAFRKELEDCNTWYIVDGMRPSFAMGRTVVIVTTPVERSKYKDFLKLDFSIKLRMDRWSQSEIDQCWRTLYAHLSKDDVDRLYSIWSGSPRYVLDEASVLCDTSWADSHGGRTEWAGNVS